MTEPSRNSELSRLSRIEKDLYYGNGLPGLTTRMKQTEDRLDMLETYNEKKESKLERKLNILIAAALALVGTLIAEMVMRLSH